MEEAKKTLTDLFVDEDKVNKEEDLFNMISPYAKIGQRTNSIIPNEKFYSLSIMERILVFLLVRKALFITKKTDVEYIKAKNIINELGMPKGTVLPNLKKLREAGYATSTAEGYFITEYQISKIKFSGLISGKLHE